MSNVPPGAQVSDDGNWWWDGSQWQPVQGQAQGQTPDPAQQSTGQGGDQQAAPTLSDDQFAQMIEAAESGAAEG
jgi:hypothetical protein